MKVAHLCLSCFYIDGYAYQENVLITEHLAQGHDVKVIASTEVYGDARTLTYVKPGRYVGKEGAEVIRLAYGVKPHAIGRKLRWYRGLRRLLSEFAPDVIFFHGLSAVALMDAARHVRAHPRCRLIVDCHEDFNNSARSFVSRNLLHRLIYRPIFQHALRSIEIVYAVTTESVAFAVDFYGAPRGKVELLPLGGYVPVEEQLGIWRSEFRRGLGFGDAHIVIAQTGKLDASKQLRATLHALSGNRDESLRLVIAGKMTPDVEVECALLIQQDSRVRYLGWQTPDQLNRTLAGVDFFLQPFGQTVTTQQAMCSRCAVLVQDLPSHRWLYCNNGLLFKDSTALPEVLDWVGKERARIGEMRNASYDFAKRKLDYTVISKQCLEERTT